MNNSHESNVTRHSAAWIKDALQILEIDDFALQIHDASFPSEASEDCGRGSPYSFAAERFFAFAASLGFNVVQLGPQGKTLRGNASPYDGSLFSRNPLSLPLGRFVASGRLSAATMQKIRLGPNELRRGVVLSQSEVHDRYQIAILEIIANATEADRDQSQQYLFDHQGWLVPDALYDALCEEHGDVWWYRWTDTPQALFDQKLFAPSKSDEALSQRRIEQLRTKYAAKIRDYAFVQWLLEKEHQALRNRLKPLEIQLFADLQVGLSPQDVWARQHLFHRDYLVGAPPSRTNAQGQAWGYGVLAPELLGSWDTPGPGLQFVKARLKKALSECDGVRIDHPQGWIDPWVYRADDPDPIHAVQNGARFYSSPDETDHPTLGKYAIARADQIDRSELPYADHRVKSLDQSQVVEYSKLIELIANETHLSMGGSRPIACEILSTLPYPVFRVLDRYRLGRFRVVQKAKLDEPDDVYRIENAEPQDWIMFGTHDTPSIWELAHQWSHGDEYRNWNRYLQSLGGAVDTFPKLDTATNLTYPLVHSLFSAILGSKARHVSIFFPDLFGITERYNQPGYLLESNWRLRLPHDFEEFYQKQCRTGKGLAIDRCLQQAIDMKCPHAKLKNFEGNPASTIDTTEKGSKRSHG